MENTNGKAVGWIFLGIAAATIAVVFTLTDKPKKKKK
jgi:hypothetical protein